MKCSSVNGWMYRNMSDSYKFSRFSDEENKKKNFFYDSKRKPNYANFD